MPRSRFSIPFAPQERPLEETMNRETKIAVQAILAVATCIRGRGATEGHGLHGHYADLRSGPRPDASFPDVRRHISEARLAVLISPVRNGTIVISLATRTPEGRRPDELAYALPYEGRHIVIFYDRVRTMAAQPGVCSAGARDDPRGDSHTARIPSALRKRRNESPLEF